MSEFDCQGNVIDRSQSRGRENHATKDLVFQFKQEIYLQAGAYAKVLLTSVPLQNYIYIPQYVIRCFCMQFLRVVRLYDISHISKNFSLGFAQFHDDECSCESIEYFSVVFFVFLASKNIIILAILSSYTLCYQY